MNLLKKQLYALPMTVGHYEEHNDAEYYLYNAIKVNRKADIPTGVYACGTYVYECPQCHKKFTKITVFLPVRDQEQYEGAFIFEDPRLENMILNGKDCQSAAKGRLVREK